MKINQTEFRNRVNKVCDNILSFYFVNPTQHRSDRLKKILTRLSMINETLDKNDYRYDNFNVLFTIRAALVNLRNVTYSTQANHVDDCRISDRKVVMTCGTLCMSLNVKKRNKQFDSLVDCMLLFFEGSIQFFIF